MTSIETLLQTILSDKSTSDTLAAVLSSKEQQSQDTNVNSNIDTYTDMPERFKQKINIIRAIMPILDEKTSEQAKFLIKLITIMSLIDSIKHRSGQSDDT